MQQSSDIGTLIHLLACATKQSPRVAIRITPDRKYASAIDFIRIVSESKQPKCVWNSVKKEMAAFSDQRSQQDYLMLKSYQFIGQRQKPTPVVSAQGIIELLFLIPGRKAKEFSRQCCDILIRFMGGDETLVDEINLNRNAANGAETSNAFFKANISQNDLQEETELKLYAAKLELEFALEVKKDEEDLRDLAEKAEIHKQLFKVANDRVSYPPARKQLIPEITILAKK
jgi:hypothetical protein